MPGESLSAMEHLKELGQEHVTRFWGILTPEERKNLMSQLNSIDFAETNEFFKRCSQSEMNGQKSDADPSKMSPVPKERYFCASDMSDDELEKNWDVGLKAIAEGKVGVLLLAGGQGTRLGVSYPKGMYDVGLPSKKVLYQLQAERIIRIQQLAVEKYPDMKGKIMWYAMTSEATDELTEKYFQDHSYFGLESSQIHFFEQGLLPCYDFNGKVIMESRSRIAMAPDGNGGLYKALSKNKILDHMEKHGIEYLHVYCVDNILVRMADPYFVGCCIANNADCGNKVVEKTDPKEPVGVVCWSNGLAFVVEYSELSKEMAERRDPDGRLTFRAGNIANHFFTRQFLRRVCEEGEKKLVHHVAKKKIPFFETDDGVGKTITPKEPNGIKMEKFVFDVFQFARNFYVYEAARSNEFSPLKNASGVDSPMTCRHDLMNLHRKWLEKSGGRILVDDGTKSDEIEVEISPLVSYGGEDLEHLVKGKELRPPIYLKSSMEMNGTATSKNGSKQSAEKEYLDNSDPTLPLSENISVSSK